MSQPTIIWSDNQGAIALTGSSLHHDRVKHTDVACHYVRERVAGQDIKLQYISADNKTADVLTKALPASTHCRRTHSMGVRPSQF